MFGGEFLKVGAHQASERRVAFDRNFADFFHQFLVNGESDVHKPIIRETLNMGKLTLAWKPLGGAAVHRCDLGAQFRRL